MLLNLAEGAGQRAGSAAKRRHYEIALGSAGEVAAALDAAASLGLDDMAAAQRVAGRLGGLLGGLVASVSRQSSAQTRSARASGAAMAAPSR